MRISKENFQAIASAILGAPLFAYIVVGKLSIIFLTYVFAAFFILIIGYHVIVRSIVKMSQKDPLIKELKRFEQEINQLPFETVKARAEEILEDKSKFLCVRASMPVPNNISHLGEYVADIFNKYKSIKAIQGEEYLGWDQVGKSLLNQAYTRIGRDLDDLTEFVVRPGENSVYEIDGSEKSSEKFEDVRYSSIYHWILIIDKILY